MDQRRKLKLHNLPEAIDGSPIATIAGVEYSWEVYVAANHNGYLVVEIDNQPNDEVTAVCFPGRLENSVYMQAMFYAADAAWRDIESQNI